MTAVVTRDYKLARLKCFKLPSNGILLLMQQLLMVRGCKYASGRREEGAMEKLSTRKLSRVATVGIEMLRGSTDSLACFYLSSHFVAAH